jgi:hypothetical protein
MACPTPRPWHRTPTVRGGNRMHDTDDTIPDFDARHWFHALNPAVSTLEFLAAVSPILDNDADYRQYMLLIGDMKDDYIGQLRRTLDALLEASKGGTPCA